MVPPKTILNDIESRTHEVHCNDLSDCGVCRMAGRVGAGRSGVDRARVAFRAAVAAVVRWDDRYLSLACSAGVLRIR